MNDAIGIIEMFGFVTAITAADVAVKVQGSVSAVTAAVDAAARTAESISGLINKHIIARPTDDSQKMANRTSVGRDKVGHIPNNA